MSLMPALQAVLGFRSMSTCIRSQGKEPSSIIPQPVTVALPVSMFSAGRAIVGWSTGSASFTFRWQDGAFALIGYDRSSMMRNSGHTESLSINYSTRRVRHAAGSMDTDRETVRWETLTSPRRWTLDTVGDGSAFEPLAGADDR